MKTVVVPHTFVALWGFGLMAVIQFLDGAFEYIARRPVYDTTVFQNHRFLWLTSHVEWTALHRPSMWHTLFLFVPAVLCGGLYYGLAIAWSTMSPWWEMFVTLVLVSAAWYAVCRLCNDFYNHVYFVLAAGICGLMLFRLILIDGWVARGYGFDTTSTVFTLLLGQAATVYLGFYFAKFPPLSPKLAVRKLTRANIVQIVLVTSWMLIMFVVLFPKALFEKLQGISP